MLHNYPYLNYAARRCEYLRKALYLQPVDEFMNTNFLAVALSQSRDEPSARHSPVAYIIGRVRRKWTPGQSPGPRPPWNMLDPSEREDVRSRLRNILDHNESFVAKIREVWKENHASVDDLKKILSTDAELWPHLQKFF